MAGTDGTPSSARGMIAMAVLVTVIGTGLTTMLDFWLRVVVYLLMAGVVWWLMYAADVEARADLRQAELKGYRRGIDEMYRAYGVDRRRH